jgi:hypothetical protein
MQCRRQPKSAFFPDVLARLSTPGDTPAGSAGYGEDLPVGQRGSTGGEGIRALRSNGAANRIRGLDSQSLIARFQRRSRALIIGFTAAVLIAVVVLEAPVSGGATTDR